MASASQQYVDKYAEIAMEQMRLYGIPASITLAQGILESANGKSRLAIAGNNHFGIKATKSWLDSGGQYGLHSDDKPNEKFCYYASVSDSYSHHSKTLKNSSRYRQCFSLSPDDYRGWANGLQKGGYATDPRYASSLISVIDRMDLAKYDRMVMEQCKAQGVTIGQGGGEAPAATVTNTPNVSSVPNPNYSFPLKRDEFLFVTSAYGNRVDPMDHSRNQFHKGIDINCNNEALLATEMNGKVVAVNNDSGTAGGKSVTIDYDRDDGTKMRVFYCHMSSIDVKVGDTVNAGQQIGVSGNTGTRTTGPHLHMGVKVVNQDGSTRNIDPAAYLAEIAQKGNITLTAMHNGKDLLEKYKIENPVAPEAPDLAVVNKPEIDTSLSPDEWMKKLLSSEDSGVGMGGMGDPIVEMIMTMFTSLMALAVSIDAKSEEEAMAIATDAALNKQLDLSSLTPQYQECTLNIREGGNPVIQVFDGSNRIATELTASDLNRLNLILSDSSLGNEEKQQRVGAIINNIIVSAQMSQNYQQGLQQGQAEQLTR